MEYIKPSKDDLNEIENYVFNTWNFCGNTYEGFLDICMELKIEPKGSLYISIVEKLPTTK